MYVVIDKKSKTILHMVNSRPGEDRKPEDVYPGFDPKTMELGRAEEQYIPAKFTIEHGKVKSLEPEPPPPKEPTAAEELASLKEAKLAEISRQAFEQRAKLIPDHELTNAALGIYDEDREDMIRETVKAFRAEYHRLETVIHKARSKKELESMVAKFPTKPVGHSGKER
ncbi:MAG TPA: hypothetical protein VFD73_26730 [Gemmatimonadales bacterium]|nr:hypothetical protein [Gemmatimonadales bacterium]